ncbi:hypothetical protein A9Q81_15920 [Gammaproteobacteria bacterium 42_54_T18]|nr:hypothetical protein A9Q81_15920 [Gammaproteobacteria bacterium 42_54_T18]
MPVLLSQINYRNVQIDEDTTGEELPVRLKTGEYRYVRWLGFLDVEKAKGGKGTPVKIKVTAYAEESFNPRWMVLEHRHIQGCMVVGEGVYGVTIMGVPKVVR